MVYLNFDLLLLPGSSLPLGIKVWAPRVKPRVLTNVKTALVDPINSTRMADANSWMTIPFAKYGVMVAATQEVLPSIASRIHEKYQSID